MKDDVVISSRHEVVRLRLPVRVTLADGHTEERCMTLHHKFYFEGKEQVRGFVPLAPIAPVWSRKLCAKSTRSRRDTRGYRRSSRGLHSNEGETDTAMNDLIRCFRAVALKVCATMHGCAALLA